MWADLRSERAALMVSIDGDPIDPDVQGVLFYLYSSNPAALREQFLAAGVAAGEILDGTPAPREQLRLADPDSCVLMVAQIEADA